MKNFKLLLATTALLSAGAMLANANTEETLDLNVKVSIEIPNSVQKISDIYIATIIPDTPGEALYVTLSTETGLIDVDGNGYTVLGTPKLGEVELLTGGGKTISVGAPVTLTNDKGDTITFTPQSDEGVIAQVTGTFYERQSYKIGGVLSTEEAVEPGNYTGKITITIVQGV